MGRARVLGVHGKKTLEARVYAQVFAKDARANFCKSHIHACHPTCYKHAAGGKLGDRVRLCRFEHYRLREVAAFPRRYPAVLRKCRNPDCSRLKDQDEMWVVNPSDGRLKRERAHPWHCAASLAVADDKAMRKYHRKGKALVLDRAGKMEREPGGFGRHLPRVCVSGQTGRCLVLRNHPFCSSSHPAAQVCMRCNLDVQCTDRVQVMV